MTSYKKLWEKKYLDAADNLWGLEPINTLVDYQSLIPKEGKVLDIGMGEGRNALYFASKGYHTVGVDISETAVNRCLKYAKEADLSIDASVSNLQTYDIEENSYSLIILSNVLNFFNDVEINNIIEKVRNGLVKGGLIYISVFSADDPGYEKSMKNARMISDFTFYRPSTKSFIHFFTRKELDSFYKDYQRIKVSESFFLDLAHGESHYHSMIELLLQK